MERPQLVYLGAVPVGYVCERCGCLVAKVEPQDLAARNMPDPWDVHVAWHLTLALPRP